MASDQMNYGALLRGAYIEVVRTVLERVAASGLPGDHQLYIAFRTDGPGVRIPDFLRTQYPDEMTVVLQHDFWDLAVGEEYFEVKLHFTGRPAHLTVPFDTICGFYDPSVPFGLQLREDAAAVPVGSDDGGESVELDADTETRDDGAQVVALDSFRKKT